MNLFKSTLRSVMLLSAGLGVIFVLLALPAVLYDAAAGDLVYARISEPFSRYLPLVVRDWSPEAAAGRALLITEVMYDPLGDEPGEEWVEIYNPGNRSVDLSGFKIGDEELAGGGEGMLRFPEGAVILPGGVILVANQAANFAALYGFLPDYETRASHPDVPVLVKHTAWSSGSIVLLNTSDEVLLLDGDDELVDAVSWGSSLFAFDPPAPDVDAGHSLERAPADKDSDAAWDWREQAEPDPGEVDLTPPSPTPSPTGPPQATATGTGSPTPGPSPTATLSPTPFGGLFLISEVVYDPADVEPGGEWLELYNPSQSPVAVADFKVGDEETPGGGEGMYRFPEPILVAPEQVLVIANEASKFAAVYGFDPDYEFVDSDPNVPDMVRYTAWAGGSVSLGNSGDEVLLLDAGDHIVDALSWGSSTYAFDPAAPDVPEGHSLERRPADSDTDTADDWWDQPAPAPGEVDLSPPPPDPSATPAATLTPTPSVTITPGQTPPSTATGTATLPPTPTQTGTPTVGPSPTVTESPTLPPTATPAASGTPGPGGDLLVSEVYYDTPGTDSQEEWIEIYNPTAAQIALDGYKIGDEETAGGGEGMVQFPPGAFIQPGEKLVVALQGAGFSALFGLAPDFEVSDTDPGVPDMLPYPVWGSGSLVLSNSGDEIVLLNSTDTPVDVLVYEGGDFPGVIAHPGVGTGHSLERFPPDQDTDDCSTDFIDQENPNPGT